MVDWAIENNQVRQGFQQGLEAISRGKQNRLYDQAIQENERNVSKLKTIEQLRDDVTAAHRTGDKNAIDNALLNLAAKDTKAAEEMAQFYGAVSWQNLVEAGYSILGATATGDYDAQNKLLEQAKYNFNLNPSHAISRGIDKIIGMKEDDPKRLELLFLTVEWLKDQGVYGPEAAKFRTSGKSADIIERETKAKEDQAAAALKNTELREQEIGQKQEQFETKRGDIPAYIQKPLDDAQTAAFESERSVGEYETLALDMDRLSEEDVKGGVARTTKEYLQNLLGTQDEVNKLYTKYRQIRGGFAMRNLPPGAASDADVAIAMEGVPPKNAGPKHIAAWLRGASKLEKINQTYYEAKSQYISANPRKGTVGFRRYWKENRDELLADAFDVSIDEIQKKQAKGWKLGETTQPEEKTITRTGTYDGRKVIEYSDGSIEYAD